jgi:site-specific DNA recombinase
MVTKSRLRNSIYILEALQDLGFLYHIDEPSHDEPFIVPVRHPIIVSADRLLAGNLLDRLDAISDEALFLIARELIRILPYPAVSGRLVTPPHYLLSEVGRGLQLAVRRQERALAVGAEAPSLLAGLIVDADGSRMTPTHATKKAKRYRYYVSASLLAGDHPQAQKGMRVPAGEIEALVLDRLRAFSRQGPTSVMALTPLDLEARTLDVALRNALKLSERWLAPPPVDMKSLVLDIVERVTIAANRIDIWLNRAKIAAALEAGGGSQRPDIDPIPLSIEAKLRRAGKGKRLVIAIGTEAEVNAGLVELIKDAFTIRIQLLSGSDDSIEAMSGRLGTNKCRLTSLIRLSYLALDIVRALFEGRQPIELTPTRLLRLSKDLPHDWSEQRHVLDFAA